MTKTMKTTAYWTDEVGDALELDLKKVNAIYKVMRTIARMGGFSHEKDYSQGKKTDKAYTVWCRAQESAGLSNALGYLILRKWGPQYPITPLNEMAYLDEEELPRDEKEIFWRFTSFADATLIGNRPWTYGDREWKKYAKGFPGPTIFRKLDTPVKAQGTVYALIWNEHYCDDDYIREYWSSHIQVFATKEEAEKARTGDKQVIALPFGEQVETLKLSRSCD